MLQTLSESKEPEKRVDNHKNTAVLHRTLAPFAIVLLIGIAIIYTLQNVYPVSVIQGSSMNPTLKAGDIISCTKDISEINAGDIIIFKHNGKHLVKRVVAVPGDVVGIHDGQLYVNDKPSPYAYEDIEDAGMLSNNWELALRGDQYFCMGDNRNRSTDSRCFGYIHKKQILYKAKKVIFPKPKILR